MSKMIPAMVFLALGLGCSSAPKLEAPILADKVAQEPATPSADAIADRGAQVFINAPDLTADQKQKLIAIHTRVYAEVNAINEEIGKSKSLLFKTLVTKNYDSRELRDIRSHIVKLDKQRLEIMFRALEDAQKVVGYGKTKDDFYKHYDFATPRRDLSSAD